MKQKKSTIKFLKKATKRGGDGQIGGKKAAKFGGKRKVKSNDDLEEEEQQESFINLKKPIKASKTGSVKRWECT